MGKLESIHPATSVALSSETLATGGSLAAIAGALTGVGALWLTPILYLSQRLAETNQKIDDGLAAVRQEVGTTNQRGLHTIVPKPP